MNNHRRLFFILLTGLLAASVTTGNVTADEPPRYTMNPDHLRFGKNTEVTVTVRDCKRDHFDNTSKLGTVGIPYIITGSSTFSPDNCKMVVPIQVTADAPPDDFDFHIWQTNKEGKEQDLAQLKFTVTDLSVSPAQGVPGKKYDLTVFVPDCTTDEMSGLRLAAPAGSGITIDSSKVLNQCSLASTATVASDALVGDVQLQVKQGDDTKWLVRFGVMNSHPGPLPPGLAPQVDVMWNVLPKNIVHDSFGHEIANNYYGVEVVIGNNSGFDLQIASIGFQVPKIVLDKEKARIPSASYGITRGSILRGQETGARNYVLRIADAVAPFAAGFLPYFKRPVASSSYATGLSVYNLLKQGFANAVPDLTVTQEGRLEAQSLRDNEIVPNNRQVRTMVFFPKKLLPPHPNNIKSGPCAGLDVTAPPIHPDDPPCVMIRLGTLVLTGRTIQYLNRVSVVATTEKPKAAVTAQSMRSFLRGLDNQRLQIAGNGLNEVSLSVPDQKDIKVEKISETGTTLEANVTIPAAVPPGIYSLILTVPGGETSRIPLEVKQVPPSNVQISTSSFTMNGEKYDLDLKTATASFDVPFSVTGKFLDDAEIKVQLDDPKLQKFVSVESSPDLANKQIVGTLHFKAGAPLGEYKLKVSNSAGPASQDNIIFTLKPPS